MRNLIPVGRIGRPHGLDGAFIVENASKDERRFAVGSTLWLDGETATVVLSRRVGGGRRAIKLDRRGERGSELSVRREDLPPADPDHLYVFELVGLEVFEGDRALGRVASVLPGAANDNLELDSGLLVPLIEDAVVAMDLERRRIDLTPGFLGSY